MKQRFAQATLDSAVRYELLKPVVSNLQTENKHLRAEILALKGQVKYKDLLSAYDSQQAAAQLRKEKRKRRIRFIAGFALGAGITAAISIF